MLRPPRVGASGYAHHFCFTIGEPEVITYGRRGEGPAEASRQLKTSKMSLWKLRKAFGELLTLVPMSRTMYAMDGERFLLLPKTYFFHHWPPLEKFTMGCGWRTKKVSESEGTARIRPRV